MNASIADIIKATHAIAVVGLSDKHERESYKVAHSLQQKGYRIIPVNPTISSVLGEKAYSSLIDIPESIVIDVVDIFRKSKYVKELVPIIVSRGSVKLVWMQEGVEDSTAKHELEAHGIAVVMNACLNKNTK